MSSVSAACARGFPAYLAEQHAAFRSRKLSQSVLFGGLSSVALFITNRTLNLEIPAPYLFVPLVFVSAIGIGEGILTANNDDMEHKEAFDDVCNKEDSE